MSKSSSNSYSDTSWIINKEVKSDLLSKEQLTKALPKHISLGLNGQVVDDMNHALSTFENKVEFRENFLGYANVLENRKFKLGDYYNAVRYVTCKLLGDSNMVAWVKTFPGRHQEYLNNGIPQRDIESRVSAYNKNKIVNKIVEQTLIPSHIINADLHQRAINKLADLMSNARNERVQMESAAKLVDALRVPEATKIELDVNIKEDKSIQELRESTLALVAQQKRALVTGAMTPKELAHSKLAVVDSEGNVINEATNEEEP